MDPRTLEILEFDRVLQKISQEATSSLGRKYVRGLAPASSFEEWKQRTAPVKDLLKLVERDQHPPLAGLFDPTEILKQLSIPGSIIEEEFWGRLIGFLELSEEVVQYREARKHNSPALSHMLSGVVELPSIVSEINKCIDDEGKVRSNASPELNTLRRRLNAAEKNLQRLIQDSISKYHDQGVLQSNYSTLRDGRHVLPVKSQFRQRISGILHGSSGTGETVYIEPGHVVAASNDLEVLKEEERAEVARILSRLTELLREVLPYLETNLAILARLDGIYALARNAAGRGWSFPIVIEQGALRLFKAHHPLLELSEGESVPITLLLDPTDRCIIISGPNAGGKTTAMKMLGLLTIMIQCGIPLPVFPDSTFPFFSSVYADIGDQQSLEDGVSTFSGHIRRIRAILEQTNERSLVLLDELGTGTDPQEGGALALSILEEFHNRAGLMVTTSHLNPVKVWADDTEGARNASFALDPKTGDPTYTLRLDLPGASEAFQIARREGLPASILNRARDLSDPKQLRMGELLQRIEDRERRLSEQLKEVEVRAKALAEQEEIAKARAQLLRDERREFKEQSLKEEGKALQEMRDKIERMIAELPSEEELERRKEALVQAREEALRQQSRQGQEARRLAEEKVSAGEVVVGQKIFVSSLGQWGEVASVDYKKNKAKVKVGSFEASVKTDDLLDHDPEEERQERLAKHEDAIYKATRGRKAGKKKSRKLKAALREAEGITESPHHAPRVTYGGEKIHNTQRPQSMTLDLHGYRVEEALKELDRFLDRSLLASFPYVKVCHGTGSGKLYRAVHDHLRTVPYIKSYRFGTPDEGGGGMTIVEL